MRANSGITDCLVSFRSELCMKLECDSLLEFYIIFLTYTIHLMTLIVCEGWGGGKLLCLAGLETHWGFVRKQSYTLGSAACDQLDFCCLSTISSPTPANTDIRTNINTVIGLLLCSPSCIQAQNWYHLGQCVAHPVPSIPFCQQPVHALRD